MVFLCSFAYYFFSLLSQPKLPDMTVTRQVPLVEHILLTLGSSQVFCEVYVAQSLVFCVVFVERCLSFCPFTLSHCVVCLSLINSC